MTSFSEICLRISVSTCTEKDIKALGYYIIMIRDKVLPNILLVCPGDQPVAGIVRDALKQLEDM